MAKSKKSKWITRCIILALLIGFICFIYSFLRALAPPEVTITEDCISTNRDFINGVTIEKLQVDSLGSEHYPVKYTVTYMTTCSIDYPKDRPPSPPNKICFAKPGKYWWTEETVNLPFIHEGLSRHSIDTTRNLFWSQGEKLFKTCPLRFEREQWYFITIDDPRVTGIFFYISKAGVAHQYYLESGISPI